MPRAKSSVILVLMAENINIETVEKLAVYGQVERLSLLPGASLSKAAL